ncbi:hypothetical protein [Leifsonia sp. NPDC077715]|uniref:hypothetical protein n=1 Tax=Leifsonia sp. NPDC077715 TaxID=3155539 RepID=UPI00343A0ED6
MTPLQMVAPFLGAAALEVLTWYQLRDRLKQAKYKALLRSSGYWIVTTATIVISGFGALLLFSDRLNAAELFLAGAAFPVLFKKLIAAFVVKSPVKLGAAEGSPGVLYDYFSVAG